MASLTKEELKTQLLNNGIDLPPSSAKKEVFVALYEEHVAPKGEFSADDDDDEIIITSKAKSPIIASNGDEGDVDVDSLDDSQLLEMLRENNIEAGPVVNSTRNLYKKKLIKVLGAYVEETEVSINEQNGGGENFSDTEPEDVAEDTANSVVVEPEPLDDTEPDSVQLSSEDEQPSGLSQPVTRKSPRTSTASSKNLNKSGSLGSLSSRSFNMSGSLDANESSVRSRFSVDTPDSSLRYTPTGRRSIHSYTVTNITKSRNGVETMNSTHSIETNNGVETKNTAHTVRDVKVPVAKCPKWIKVLMQVLLVVLALGVLYYVYFNHLQKVEAIDQMQEAIQNAVNKALGVSESNGDTGEAAGDALGDTGKAATVDAPPVDSRPKNIHV